MARRLWPLLFKRGNIADVCSCFFASELALLRGQNSASFEVLPEQQLRVNNYEAKVK
jgi:hypothetical protein